jgi:hypothetical protein
VRGEGRRQERKQREGRASRKYLQRVRDTIAPAPAAAVRERADRCRARPSLARRGPSQLNAAPTHLVCMLSPGY